MAKPIDNRAMSLPKQRRLTPCDADWVLDEWLRLEKHYLSLDFSIHEAHVRISNDYRCSKMTVYRHLKKAHHQRVKSKTTPYSERIKRPGVRQRENERSREYRRFSKHPDKYISSAFEKAGKQILSMEEISVKIRESCGYLPRIQTLEAVVEKFQKQHGGLLLTEIPGSLPALYENSEQLLPRD
jgi:hypothetical protein